MLKKIGLSLAELSAIIIVLATIKLILYYSAFNLPVKYFISISELGMAISQDLLLLVPVVLILFGLTVIVGNFIEKKIRQN